MGIATPKRTFNRVNRLKISAAVNSAGGLPVIGELTPGEQSRDRDDLEEQDVTDPIGNLDLPE
jgi:hypothetical protein